MAFRDLVDSVAEVNEEISVEHGMLDHSTATSHAPVMFNSITEAPGHRSAINVLARDRLCSLFEVTPGELIDILAWAMENPSKPEIVDASFAQVLENTQDEVDLNALPIPWHYREDRGRYQSASVIIAEYDGVRNMSYHRQFLRDKNHLVVRLVPRHLRTMVDQARAQGHEVNIAIVNAPDPVVLLAGAMSFDEPIDELTIAAALHEKLYNSPLQLVELPNGIQVPADAEYAMWGRITVDDDDEGPYVDITGTVDDVRQEPVIEVDGVLHRDDPIFHALIPGEAEHKTLMGLPRSPTIKEAVANVVDCIDVHMTEGGCGWLAAVVKIRKTSEDDGRKAIEAALAGHRSMKMVTVVDEDIEITNPVRVEWAMVTRWQPDRDTHIFPNQKGSSLDPSRYEDGLTSKVGFDATIHHSDNPEGYMSVQ